MPGHQPVSSSGFVKQRALDGEGVDGQVAEDGRMLEQPLGQLTTRGLLQQAARPWAPSRSDTRVQPQACLPQPE
jgi:hypothetical protein